MIISKISKILNKQTLNTILVIIGVSAFLGFIYNILQPNPLPLIFTPKHIDKVADSLLFNQNDDAEKPIQNKEINRSIPKVLNDRLKKSDSTLARNELSKQETQENFIKTNEQETKKTKICNLRPNEKNCW